MEVTFKEEMYSKNEVRIGVVGVGGGGCNTINHIIRHGVHRAIKLIALNTDATALESTTAHSKILLGEKTTQGFGAGMNPEKGKKSAEESYEIIKDELKEFNIIFIATGLGGGTGTGATPIVAKAAKDIGALTIAVVTTPFKHEMNKRAQIAEAGLKELKDEVDTIIVIPNEKLLSVIDKTLSAEDSFKLVDNVASQAVRGVAGFILSDSGGGMNIDFADLNTIMEFKGLGLIGIGEKDGEDSAIEAVKEAIESPLLDNISIKGAKGAIIHYTISRKYPLSWLTDAGYIVQQQLDENADCKHGWTYDDSLEPMQIKVTLVITGFEKEILQTREQEREQHNKIPPRDPNITMSVKYLKDVVGGTRNYPTAYDEDIVRPTFLRQQQD